MWFSLGVDDFLLKYDREEEKVKVYVTDFKKIWFKELNDQQILSICKQFNPLIEAPPNKLIDKCLHLFNQSKEVEKKTDYGNDGELVLNLKTSMTKVKFEFEFALQKGDDQMLYQELTLPLLMTTKRLQSRGEKLIDIIKSKDAEINEYRSMVQIKRSSMITVPFVEKEFDEEEKKCGTALSEIYRKPSLFFDERTQNMFLTAKEIITEEKRKKCEKRPIKEEAETAKSVTDTKKFVESEPLKSQIKLETNDIKKRKVVKHPSRLKL